MADRKLIEEAVDEVTMLRKHALENAKTQLAEEMTPQLQRAVDRRINEELGGGGDPPSNYDEDGEQKRKGDNLAADGEDGEDLADDGDGPAIIEAGLEDDYMDDEDMDFMDDEEDDDELDLGDDIDVEDDDEDMGMDYMDDEEDDFGPAEDDFEGDDDVVDIVDDEEEDEFRESAVRENVAMKRKLRVLQRENRRLVRALTTLKETVEEVNLFNARLAGTQKIARKFNLGEAKVDRVIDRFDECESIAEVKRTYRTLNEGFQMSRSKAKRHRVNRPNRQSAASQINEGVRRGPDFSNMRRLAGLD